MFLKRFVFVVIGLLALGGVFLIFSDIARAPLPPPLSQNTQEIQNSLTPVNSNPAFHAIRIGEQMIYVEFARTPSEMSRGLSGRESLPEDRGMLFVYGVPGSYHFWMPDMHFSIDIIWLDENYTIVDITPNVSPDTYPETFTSARPAQYVLEVNAGWAHLNEISVGMQVLADL